MSVATPAENPYSVPVGAPVQVTRWRRLPQAGLSDTDRNFAIAIHLSPFACLLFGPLIFTPLILWLIRKDRSAFVDDHGREVVNFGISYFIYMLLLFWTVVIPIILGIVAIVNLIRGAVAASNGEYFRYPLTIRFLS